MVRIDKNHRQLVRLRQLRDKTRIVRNVQTNHRREIGSQLWNFKTGRLRFVNQTLAPEIYGIDHRGAIIAVATL